jgi:hypothetical protein
MHGREKVVETPGGVGSAVAQPIELFRGPIYGIVDGQLVNVIGVTDLPGMSLAYICADPDEGWTAPVPFSETRIFPTLTRAALQALLETERNTGRT